ncbi:MAG: PKD domain-containing protein [Euryarchaeota archaeon]|nr:PKD domain-containing protein [Euryarchaeota archaeon]
MLAVGFVGAVFAGPVATYVPYREAFPDSPPTVPSSSVETGMPSLDPDDARFLGVAGAGLETLAGVKTVLFLGLPEGTTTFTVGLFDGDVGGAWDSGTGSFVYRLYKDPLKTGTTTTLVDTIASAQAVDDDWHDREYTTDSGARAPSGNYFYRLEASWEADPPLLAYNNFKVRTSGQVSLGAGQDFGFAAGPQNIGSDPDVGSGDPNPGDQNDPNANSYDGTFTFFFYVPKTLTSIEFWDGDADRADDTDDTNTPNTDPDGPGPAQPEGSHPGIPADDGEPGREDCCKVTTNIFYDVLDPNGTLYTNGNPSGNVEWERFAIGPASIDPDVVVTGTLPAGLWRVRVRGMDAHNLAVLRSTYEIYMKEEPPLPVHPAPLVEPDHDVTTDDDVTLTFAHTVTNKGEAPSDFDLTAVSDHAWATAIFHDLDADGVLDPGEPPITTTGVLAKDAFIPILVTLVVPPLTAGTVDVTTVTAISLLEWAVQGSAHDTTRVRVNVGPTASAGGPYTASEGSSITFDASGSSDPDGDALTYEWDWDGDGTFDEISDQPTAARTFGDDLVDHVVTLRVSDGEFADTASALITITNVAPALSLGVGPTGDEGGTLRFEVRVTDPGSDDLTVFWSGDCGGWSSSRFYPNDPADVPDPDPSPDVHPRDVTDAQNVVCGDDGTFDWMVEARDDDGGVTTASGAFLVGNLPPAFTVSPPSMTATDEGLSVTLEAIAGDPGSDDLTFTWTWEHGPTEVRTHFNDGAAADPDPSPNGTFPFSATDSSTHTYGDDCVCRVALLVEDDDGGSVTYTTTIEVRNLSPSASIDGITQSQTGNLPADLFLPNRPIRFEGSSEDPGSDDLTFAWDFGDGGAASTTYFNDGAAADPDESTGGTFPFAAGDVVEHTYTVPGTYTVKLRVEDDDVGFAEDTRSITIISPLGLKQDAIQRIKALKFEALARGDDEFVHHLDRAEEWVWKSLGYKHPFRPIDIAADLGSDVTVVKEELDKVTFLLGDPWLANAGSYAELRVVWANGVVLAFDLPDDWPRKALHLHERPWVDAWRHDLHFDVGRHGKEPIRVKVHAHDASLGFALYLDNDRIATLGFTYEIRPWWIDDLHLDPKDGHKVFKDERHAAHDLVTRERMPDGGEVPRCRLDPGDWTEAERDANDAECNLIANILVEADETLALVALEEAKALSVSDPEKARKVAHEIEKAERDLARAYDEWGKLHYDHAIGRFRHVWMHAQHAIQAAMP